MLGNRSLAQVAGALVRPRHYLSAFNMMRRFESPVAWGYRYLTGKGDYPATVGVRAGGRTWAATLYSHHDLLTLNEVFCRMDYPVQGSEEVVVDFGSNIGLTGLYFLAMLPKAHLHLFEPVPTNIDRLVRQLSGFEDRYTLHRCAVDLAPGRVTFGIESTGRYGGIGRDETQSIEVDAVEANAVLADIVAQSGRIDVLKVDVEGLEATILSALAPALRPKIGAIFAECAMIANPLADTHDMRQRGTVASFRLRPGGGPIARAKRGV